MGNNIELVYPDYKNNSVNIIASILEAHGLSAPHSSLPSFTNKPANSYRHLFFLVFDGLGYHMLNEKIPGIEKQASNLLKLTSVFPSTTAAAVTSLLTGQTPLEHGYIGWTLYLKEYNNYINALIGKDPDEFIDYHTAGLDYHEILDPKPFLKNIETACPERDIWYISPDEFENSFYTAHTSLGAKPLYYKRELEITGLIENIVKAEKPSSTFVYSPFPDYICHREGLNGSSVNLWFSWFKGFLNELNAICDGNDALVLISADHGMIDIDEYFHIDQDKTLMETLIIPPFPEARFASFFVKEHRKNQFEERFHEVLGNDYMLLDRDSFFDKELLGIGKAHDKIDDLIGNYIAIATGKKGIKWHPLHNPERGNHFKANHAGLTALEMEVPLIVYEYQ